MIINGHQWPSNDHQLEFLHQAELMWGSMDDEVKTTYGKSYFDQKVQRGKLREKLFYAMTRHLRFQVAIMKSYMTGGITDISPVINSYTDALLDVFPQVMLARFMLVDCPTR